jgi:hypothetical protein
MKEQNIVPKSALKMGVSVLIIFFGHILTLDSISTLLGFESRLIGVILQLIAIAILFVLFRNLVPFFELEWREKVEYIYILNKEGLNLYTKSFTKETVSIDEHFVSGVLSSVNIMLNELMNTRDNKISIIKKRNKVVTIYSSALIIAVLVSTEELEYYKHNLKKLVLKIEILYKNLLKNWDGDRTKFAPIEDIIDEIFPI